MGNLLKYLLVALVGVCMAFSVAVADTFFLRLDASGEGNAYYNELIRESLQAEGVLVQVEPVRDETPARLHLMLDQGALTAYPQFPVPDFDQRWLILDIGLTHHLAEAQVILVHKEGVRLFAEVDSPATLRAALEGLQVGKDYRLVGIGGDHPWRGKGSDWMVEPRLLLIRQHDVVLYLSPVESELRPLLIKGLEDAGSNGLMDRLIRKHWADAYRELRLDDRIPVIFDGD